jgi:uncharacterized protein (DUF3820 family)
MAHTQNAYLKLLYRKLMMENLHPDPQILQALVRMKMPFGKYKDTLLCDLPIAYLEWFKKAGFPQGKLGILLETLLEIKLNGLNELLATLKKMESGKT